MNKTLLVMLSVGILGALCFWLFSEKEEPFERTINLDLVQIKDQDFRALLIEAFRANGFKVEPGRGHKVEAEIQFWQEVPKDASSLDGVLQIGTTTDPPTIKLENARVEVRTEIKLTSPRVDEAPLCVSIVDSSDRLLAPKWDEVVKRKEELAGILAQEVWNYWEIGRGFR